MTPRPFQGAPESFAFFTAVHESISHALQLVSVPSMTITATAFTEEALHSQYTLDPICHTFAYKKVTNRVKPVATTMPQHAHIVHCFPEDLLRTLPHLSTHPPEFTPGKHLMHECMTELGVLNNLSLWPKEQNLTAQVLLLNKLGLAWDKSEKGCFRDDYFNPVIIPTIEHTPWVH